MATETLELIDKERTTPLTKVVALVLEVHGKDKEWLKKFVDGMLDANENKDAPLLYARRKPLTYLERKMF